MIETLLGTLFGGAFRLAPEILKWIDRKDERKHELAMFDKQLEADRLHAESGERLAAIEAGKAVDVAELQALIAGAKAQAVRTGIKWVDAVNSLMRPALTFYWCVILYTVALAAQYMALTSGGLTNTDAILALWGPQEKAIVASMFAFWFMDRTLRKYNGH